MCGNSTKMIAIVLVIKIPLLTTRISTEMRSSENNSPVIDIEDVVDRKLRLCF